MAPPTKRVDKIIISSNAALARKYGKTNKDGKSGDQIVRDAINQLIATDRGPGRQLVTEYWAVDDAATMARINRNPVPVEVSGDPFAEGRDQAFKDAVDAIYCALTPDYLVLLGSDDIVPYQSLRAAAIAASPQPTGQFEVVKSDLPYACQEKFSDQAEAFTKVGRVVGRIPDIPFSQDPGHDLDHFVALLDGAAKATPLGSAPYCRPFVVSAQRWQTSTQATLAAAFRSAGALEGLDALQTSPASGPRWEDRQMAKRSHYINCHGKAGSRLFFGDPGESKAINADRLAEHDLTGVVVAAQCCFGAQVFTPTNRDELAIASTYLVKRAYAFFGCTDASFGSTDSNEHADLICRFFFQHVLDGESTGRAALLARQEYVAQWRPDPLDHRTLATFVLLGDPSIHPASDPPAHVADRLWLRENRITRRQRDMHVGIALGEATARCASEGTSISASEPVNETASEPANRAMRELAKLAEAFGVQNWTIRRFPVRRAPDGGAVRGFPAPLQPAVPDAVQMLISATPTVGEVELNTTQIILADEVDGYVTNFRRVTAKGGPYRPPLVVDPVRTEGNVSREATRRCACRCNPPDREADWDSR